MYAQKAVWLGRLTKFGVQRGTKNERREDFLTNLRRLTLVHEMSGNEEIFRFQEGCGFVPLLTDTSIDLEVMVVLVRLLRNN